jgi:hypothetical protein
MEAPSKMSLSQGEEYNVMHEGQHGGGSNMLGAPAFESQTLPASMVEAARVGGTLNAFKAIQGMQDGGASRRRRRKSRGRKHGGGNNNMKEMEGGRRRRKTRKSRGRKHGGGNNNNNNTMEEMEGGRRRRKSRKSRGRKHGGGNNNKKNNNAMEGGRRRRSRKQGGGSHGNMHPADVSSPGMLLGNSSARYAEGAMNPEWQLAKDPQAFVPNSVRV